VRSWDSVNTNDVLGAIARLGSLWEVVGEGQRTCLVWGGPPFRYLSG
jgi:hypothetical protein